EAEQEDHHRSIRLAILERGDQLRGAGPAWHDLSRRPGAVRVCRRHRYGVPHSARGPDEVSPPARTRDAGHRQIAGSGSGQHGKMSNSASAATRKGLFGRLEKVFVALLLIDVALYFFPGASGIKAIVTLVVYILGMILAVRFVRRNLKLLLWRLRNRLIVSYLFIAVVPISLVLALVAIGGYMLMGQVAIYTVL